MYMTSMSLFMGRRSVINSMSEAQSGGGGARKTEPESGTGNVLVQDVILVDNIVYELAARLVYDHDFPLRVS